MKTLKKIAACISGLQLKIFKLILKTRSMGQDRTPIGIQLGAGVTTLVIPSAHYFKGQSKKVQSGGASRKSNQFVFVSVV